MLNGMLCVCDVKWDVVCVLSFAVLLHNAIPFVGFGFLDNAIMIVAVSYTTLSNVYHV
jgi:hypothetical protein